jgi:hypothetical protein
VARVGRPGSIRGEAAARGISEYQVRVERELARAASEGREPSRAKAAGKGSNERRRDLYRLQKLVVRSYPKQSPSYPQVWKDTRAAYDRYGFQAVQDVLVLQGLNTAYYLNGAHMQLEFSWSIARNMRNIYEEIPASLFWYHGALG